MLTAYDMRISDWSSCVCPSDLSANHAFAMYPGLTAGAIGAIMAKASPELQARFVPNMVSGKWAGTMNLTEPHAGTDLGLIRTRAEPRGDGSYSITGTTIFISGGEHDLTEKDRKSTRLNSSQ